MRHLYAVTGVRYGPSVIKRETAKTGNVDPGFYWSDTVNADAMRSTPT